MTRPPASHGPVEEPEKRQGAETSEWAAWLNELFAEGDEPECGDRWDDETVTPHVCGRVAGHSYTHLSRDGWQWQR